MSNTDPKFIPSREFPQGQYPPIPRPADSLVTGSEQVPIGVVAEGQVLVRSGNQIIGQVIGGGGLPHVLDPGPNVIVSAGAQTWHEGNPTSGIHSIDGPEVHIGRVLAGSIGGRAIKIGNFDPWSEIMFEGSCHMADPDGNGWQFSFFDTPNPGNNAGGFSFSSANGATADASNNGTLGGEFSVAAGSGGDGSATRIAGAGGVVSIRAGRGGTDNGAGSQTGGLAQLVGGIGGSGGASGTGSIGGVALVQGGKGGGGATPAAGGVARVFGGDAGNPGANGGNVEIRGGFASGGGTFGTVEIGLSNTSQVRVGAALKHEGSLLGFFNATAVSKPTVVGSRGGNAALASLLTQLASLGLVTDSTT